MLLAPLLMASHCDEAVVHRSAESVHLAAASSNSAVLVAELRSSRNSHAASALWAKDAVFQVEDCGVHFTGWAGPPQNLPSIDHVVGGPQPLVVFAPDEPTSWATILTLDGAPAPHELGDPRTDMDQLRATANGYVTFNRGSLVGFSATGTTTWSLQLQLRQRVCTSPDGQWIAAVGPAADGTLRLTLAHADGSVVAQQTVDKQLAGNPDWLCALHDDGTALVVLVFRGADQKAVRVTRFFVTRQAVTRDELPGEVEQMVGVGARWGVLAAEPDPAASWRSQQWSVQLWDGAGRTVSQVSVGKIHDNPYLKGTRVSLASVGDRLLAIYPHPDQPLVFHVVTWNGQGAVACSRAVDFRPYVHDP